MMIKYLTVLTTFFVVCSIGFQPKFFEILIDRLEIVYEDPSVSKVQVKVRKVNKTRSFVGFITLFEPRGNEVILEMKVLKKQGGEYRYLPYRIPAAPFCDVLTKDTYCYPDVAKNSDFPEDIANNCPMPAGNYSLNGVFCNMDNIPKVLSSGDYALEITFDKNGALVGHFMLYGSVNSI